MTFNMLPPERQWEKSFSAIATLDPLVQSTVKDEIARFAWEGIYVQVAPDGARRTFEKQEELWLQGRPEEPGGREGNKVTWVRVGVHCFGLAWDYCIDGLTAEGWADYPLTPQDSLIDGKGRWPNPTGKGKELWLRMAEMSRDTFGLRCGAFFGTPDYPHREWTDGLTIAELVGGKRPKRPPGWQPEPFPLPQEPDH